MSKKYNNGIGLIGVYALLTIILGIIVIIIKFIIKNKTIFIIIGICLASILTIICLILLIRKIYINYKNKKKYDFAEYTSKNVYIEKTINKSEINNTFANEIKKPKEREYQTKTILTKCEQNFYDKIKPLINNSYILFPQIPLSSIINKTSTHKYANELYRTIDFGIFDLKFNPIVLIEINDKTHFNKKRQTRDIKVENILKQINIPLIKLWTHYENTQEYIKNRLSKYININ